MTIYVLFIVIYFLRPDSWRTLYMAMSRLVSHNIYEKKAISDPFIIIHSLFVKYSADTHSQ